MLEKRPLPLQDYKVAYYFSSYTAILLAVSRKFLKNRRPNEAEIKDRRTKFLTELLFSLESTQLYLLQAILFAIDCTIFHTNLHELFCLFISWTNRVHSGKFMDNWWISCQLMVDMEHFYDNLIIVNLYMKNLIRFFN